MSDLPTGWSRCRLGDLLAYGSTRKAEPTSIPADGWVLELEDIEKDTSRILSRATAAERRPKSTKNRFDCGDVLYGKLRPYLNKVVIADNAGYATTEIVPLNANGSADQRYLFYWLKSPEFLDYVSAVSHGINMPRLGTEAGNEAPMILAPLAEQKRIADKLDTLLARIDACRDRLDRLPGLIKRFRHAVLEAAVTGQLTAAWRDAQCSQEDADLVVSALSSAHEAAGGHKRGNAAPPTEDAHDLTTDHFPPSWRLVELKEVVDPRRPVSYGILKPGPEFSDGVPYVRVADFPDDRLQLSGIRKTSPSIDEEFKRARLRPGDILLSIRGTVGRVVLVPDELSGANITQDTARLAVQSAMNTDFVAWYLRSQMAQLRMSKAIKGVAVRGINIGDVRALQIPVPSRAEQAEIVRRIAKLMTFAERLDQRLRVGLARVTQLPAATFAKAFRGELVPQDPNDEHAQALLDRLNSQLNQSDRPKRGRRAASTAPV